MSLSAELGYIVLIFFKFTKIVTLKKMKMFYTVGKEIIWAKEGKYCFHLRWYFTKNCPICNNRKSVWSCHKEGNSTFPQTNKSNSAPPKSHTQNFWTNNHV